jgi:hypothetical protein
MKRVIFAAIVFATFLSTTAATAGVLDVSGTLSSTPGAGGTFNYTITLNNLGASTDSLQTFWFSWAPGADFGPINPNSVTPPSGWTDFVTNGGAGDGYGIQFVTNGAGLAPANSLSFMFNSSDTPAQYAGNSPFYPGVPIGTSFVYQGAPFSGDTKGFVVTESAVPEPCSLVISGIGGAALLLNARRRRRIQVS